MSASACFNSRSTSGSRGRSLTTVLATRFYVAAGRSHLLFSLSSWRHLSHRSFLTLPRVRRVDPKNNQHASGRLERFKRHSTADIRQRQADRRWKSCEMQNRGPGSAREWRVECAVGTVASVCSYPDIRQSPGGRKFVLTRRFLGDHLFG